MVIGFEMHFCLPSCAAFCNKIESCKYPLIFFAGKGTKFCVLFLVTAFTSLKSDIESLGETFGEDSINKHRLEYKVSADLSVLHLE